MGDETAALAALSRHGRGTITWKKESESVRKLKVGSKLWTVVLGLGVAAAALAQVGQTKNALSRKIGLERRVRRQSRGRQTGLDAGKDASLSGSSAVSPGGP
jgi:hypothetical protein